jgi:hypothetical protein
VLAYLVNLCLFFLLIIFIVGFLLSLAWIYILPGASCTAPTTCVVGSAQRPHDALQCVGWHGLHGDRRCGALGGHGGRG